MGGIIASHHKDLGSINSHGMAITCCRKVSRRTDGSNHAISIKFQAIHFVTSRIGVVNVGASNKVNIAHGHHSTHAPKWQGKTYRGLFPITDGAIIVKGSLIDFVTHTIGIATANHEKMSLGSHHRHISQGYRQRLKCCPT